MASFYSCSGDEKLKYGIVLTDGYSSGNTQAAVNSTPADITLIAIGFGNVNNQTLNVISRNIPENKFQVNTVNELNSLVDSLKDKIG